MSNERVEPNTLMGESEDKERQEELAYLRTTLHALIMQERGLQGQRDGICQQIKALKDRLKSLTC